MKPELNLSWGEPYITRQALVETLGPLACTSLHSIHDMGYSPHFGTSKLIEQLKDLAKRHSGRRPKHLFVTLGCTGAIGASLYALRDHKKDYVLTNRRYYSLYPSIIGVSGMAMVHDVRYKKEAITLVDSPSNPEGLVFPFEDVDVWDAAYASKTYSNGGHVPVKWKIMCGSLSKTLGLSGLRLGWVSTDDDELAKSLGIWITASYIGLSAPSMAIAEQVLDILDFDKFEQRSSGYLDSNREEVQKLLDMFGQGNVPTRGMFAIVQLGKFEIRALQKANIKWQPGSLWGEDDNWARLSLGQTREIVRAAVQAALK
jgi:aspartate/methionine/tyrosine aminotransferase